MNNNVRTPHGREAEYPPASDSAEYHVHHDPEGSANLSTTVVHALADVMGVDVTDGGYTLYQSIDPDALDGIFAPTVDGTPRPPGHVAFTVDGYRVTVYSSGRIVITPPAGSPR